jgi:hypothetical protein
MVKLLPVSNGNGTIVGADVTNVSVTCIDNTYSLGGLVSGLVAGDTVALQNNGGDDLTLSANGAFSFATPVAFGDAYAVTVLTQPSAPSETCTVSNGSGIMPAGDVTTVSVTCTVNTFTVGGALTGLAGGASVELQLNGADSRTLTADGNLAFAPLADGAAYDVSVATPPAGQTCTVSNGSGTLSGANVTNVAVRCVDNYTVTATVASGLGTVSCTPARVAAGDSSTCTALPSAGFQVQSWGGACAFAGRNPQCALTNIQENKVSTVRFAAAGHPAAGHPAAGHAHPGPADQPVQSRLGRQRRCPAD